MFETFFLRRNIKNNKKLLKFIKFILNNEKPYLYKCKINYIFVSSEDIYYFNKLLFNRKRNTDVISINYLNTNKHLVSDIFISIPDTYFNSTFYRVGFYYELLRNIIHGTLHCVGYNDLTISDKKNMLKIINYYIIIYIIKYILKLS